MVGELLRAVVIIVIVVVVLAVAAGGAAVVLRLRHRPPRALPPRVYGSRRSVHPVEDRSAPRAPPGRPELHLHFHGLAPEDVSAILARVNHEDCERVD